MSAALAPPRVILCSSDAFGEAALTLLAARDWLAGLVTQPDRPRGRSKQPEPLPIRVRAESLGIPVLTPEKIGAPESLAALEAAQPDFLVIAAYAQYLPLKVRTIPRLACLNIHPSLLPRYRGPAPIQAALWSGDTVTGVAIHYTEKGIDTGDILAMVEEPIPAEATGGSLRLHLGRIGAELLIATIGSLLDGSAISTPQDHARATLTRLITAQDRELPLELPAAALAHRVRALAPDPGALLPWADSSLRILAARNCPDVLEPALAGTLLSPGKNRLAVACGEGWLELLEVQPAGRQPMPIASFLNGLRGNLPTRVESRPGDPRPLVVPIADALRLQPVNAGGGHG